MNAIKLRARLAARVQNYSKGIGGPEISNEDIMLAISLLPEQIQWLIWAKWFDDESARDKLLAVLKYEAELQARSAKWRIPDQAKLQKVCEMAIFETTYPRLCGKCGGHSFCWMEKQKRGRRKGSVAKPLKVQCPVCKGQGVVEYAERWHYTFAGINRRAWVHWARGYRGVIIPILKEWESEFQRRVLALIKPNIMP